jgi:hypothetical protein
MLVPAVATAAPADSEALEAGGTVDGASKQPQHLAASGKFGDVGDARGDIQVAGCSSSRGTANDLDELRMAGRRGSRRWTRSCCLRRSGRSLRRSPSESAVDSDGRRAALAVFLLSLDRDSSRTLQCQCWAVVSITCQYAHESPCRRCQWLQDGTSGPTV